EVLALSRGENRFSQDGKYTYISADVCDVAELERVLESFQPDCVIHTVAMANVDVCEEDTESCNRVNVESVKTLCALAEKLNFHLIYLSTDFIFDGKNGPYCETDLPNPLN